MSASQFPQIEGFHFVSEFDFLALASADIREIMAAAAQTFAAIFVSAKEVELQL